MSEFIFTPYLTSGLNTRSADFLVNPDENIDILNFSYSTDGILEKRLGSSPYNTSALKKILGMGRYYFPTGNKKLIVGANINASASVYKGDDATGGFTPIKTGWTKNAKVNFQQWKSYYLVVNGNNACLRYDGATAWNLGLKRPASAPVGVGGDAGVLTGDFYYRFTFYNSNTMHESHPSAVSEKITVVDKKINLTGILAVTDANEVDGIHRRLYRIGGSTDDEDTPLSAIWQLVVEIQNNTATTYTDNKKNSELGLEMGEDDTDFTCPLGNHEPPLGQYIAFLHDAIFLAGCPDNPDLGTNPNTIYPSKCEDGESFPFDYDLKYFKYGYQIGQVAKEKDIITNIIPYQDTIIAWQNNSMYQLLGDDFSNYSLRLIDPEIGQSGQTAVNCDGLLVWWHLKTGIQAWDGSSFVKPCPSDKIEPTILAVDPTKAKDAIACYHKKKYFLYLP